MNSLKLKNGLSDSKFEYFLNSEDLKIFLVDYVFSRTD